MLTDDTGVSIFAVGNLRIYESIYPIKMSVTQVKEKTCRPFRIVPRLKGISFRHIPEKNAPCGKAGNIISLCSASAVVPPWHKVC